MLDIEQRRYVSARQSETNVTLCHAENSEMSASESVNMYWILTAEFELHA